MKVPPIPMPVALSEFYGQPWVVTPEGLVLDPKFEKLHITRIKTPYDMFYGDQKISKIAVNYSCSDTLLDCLEKIGKEFTQKERAHYQLDRYGGCFNFRPMRGVTGKTTVSKLSMHAYGAAIDLAPALNPLGAYWNEGNGMMPLEAIEIFEKAGWKWGGRYKTRPDCMHFEFCQ